MTPQRYGSHALTAHWIDSHSARVFDRGEERSLGLSSSLTSGAFTLSALRLGPAAGAWLLFEVLSDICVCCRFYRRRQDMDDCDKQDFSRGCRTGSLLRFMCQVSQPKSSGAILLAPR
jgi:hypothetical protein